MKQSNNGGSPRVTEWVDPATAEQHIEVVLTPKIRDDYPGMYHLLRELRKLTDWMASETPKEDHLV